MEYSSVVAVGLAVCLVAVPSSVGVADAAGLEASITAPDSATTSEAVSIGGTVTLPDLVGSHESDVVISLLVDGQPVASKTVTVSDGASTDVRFSHQFSTSGTHEVALSVATTVAGQSFETRASTTIDVTAPATSSVTTTAPSTSTTPAGVSLRGAAFPVPASLQDDVSAYRESNPVDLPYAFILATQDQLYLVFTASQPATGMVTVAGVGTPGGGISHQGLEFGVVVAHDAAYTTEGTPTSLTDLSRSPDAYGFTLVETTGHHTRFSSLADSDTGNDVAVASSSGRLTQEPPTARLGLFAAAQQLATADRPSGMSGTARIATVDLSGPQYWVTHEQTVDAIVIPPSSAAFRYLQTISSGAIARPEGALLYTVATASQPTVVDSVTALTNTPGEYRGDIVRVTADGAFSHLSTQETILHSTPCGNDAFPVKEACTPLPADVLIHAGVLWPAGGTDGAPLVVVGASSHEQDTPATTDTGTYRVTGTLRAGETVSPALRGTVVLFATDIEQTSTGGPVPSGVASARDTLVETVRSNITHYNDTLSNPAGTTQSTTADPGSTAAPTTATSSATNGGGGGVLGPATDGVSVPGFTPTSTLLGVLLGVLLLRRHHS